MIDLRSDTLTMPDAPMLETIMMAQLGDDGRVDANGRGEDPTINKLEDLMAELTGKEAGLLCPTGTMGNTCGVLSWCKAQDKVLVHEQQHLLLTEKFLFDEQFCRMVPIKYSMNDKMTPDVEQIDRLLQESGSKLLCLENTHNFSGGYVIPVEEMAKLRAVADKHGAHIHMDGARLLHAAAALGVAPKEITQYVDSVMVCISKGLGAPVGSVLCSTKAQIAKAREIRKVIGGGMRQAGIIAAPGIYALQHNLERMKDDIAHAKLTAALLQGKLQKLTMQADVQSNILVLDCSKASVTPSEFCVLAEKKGLLIKTVLQTCVRLVYYKGITESDARKAAEIILALDQEI